jgi:hypothetical protein
MHLTLCSTCWPEVAPACQGQVQLLSELNQPRTSGVVATRMPRSISLLASPPRLVIPAVCTSAMIGQIGRTSLRRGQTGFAANLSCMAPSASTSPDSGATLYSSPVPAAQGKSSAVERAQQCHVARIPNSPRTTTWGRSLGLQMLARLAFAVREPARKDCPIFSSRHVGSRSAVLEGGRA